MKKLSRLISPQRAKTNAKREQNAAYNQAQVAAQSGQMPQDISQFDRRQRTNLKQMQQGNYNPPPSRQPMPPMAPPMQAPQGQGGGAVGIGNFMQQQMPTPPEGQGWIKEQGGGYSNPTMFAQQQQQMAQDPRYQQQGMAIPRPVAGQGGGATYGMGKQQMGQAPQQVWQKRPLGRLV